MTEHISLKHTPTRVARTADGEVLVVDAAGGWARAADVVLIKRTAESTDPARLIGRLHLGSHDGVEARVVAALVIAADGRPLREFLAHPLPMGGEGHDWGALGMPDGLETLVRPAIAEDDRDELAVAGTSRGATDLARHTTLSLAPGDWLDIGRRSGMVTAIDRRARTVEIDSGGERVIISIEDIEQNRDQEQPQ